MFVVPPRKLERRSAYRCIARREAEDHRQQDRARISGTDPTVEQQIEAPSGGDHRIHDHADAEIGIFPIGRRGLDRVGPQREDWSGDFLAGALQLLSRLARIQPDEIRATVCHVGDGAFECLIEIAALGAQDIGATNSGSISLRAATAALSLPTCSAIGTHIYHDRKMICEEASRNLHDHRQFRDAAWAIPKAELDEVE
jgi:hypothetical protein